MAQYAAHLVTNVIEKPSIFEVLAQENLADGLRNAARYLISFLSEHYPGRFAFLTPHVEEFIAAADLVIQLYHLQIYHSSFSEHYYGLKRVACAGSFRTKHIVKSLLALVVLPYMREKVDAAFQEARNSQTPAKFSRLLIKLYPYFYLGWEGVNLGCTLLYAIEKFRVHSLTLAFASVELASAMAHSVDVGRPGNGSVLWKLFRGVMNGMSMSLVTGAFLLQFLDWWYSQRQPQWTVPVPASRRHIDVADGTCPICYKEISDDTVLTVSGFVFCYACIHSFVTEKRCCPVTGYPASDAQLVRIFTS
ncbi:peroxisome assembly protein 12-like [Ornithodoros turicata]|uniref:Peroxisome assembly protein 12 n=1 Tax=Ornithodoros turicata TaxID=34597 RepID=A0A2R5L745_9ACAR